MPPAKSPKLTTPVANDPGVFPIRSLFSQEALRELEFALPGSGAAPGLRIASASARLISAIAQPALQEAVATQIGAGCRPVQVIVFEKRPGNNWGVRWHQDVTIAVSERHELAGFGPWSSKAGVPHVQAPAETMAGLIAARIHLDPANERNGALRVIPGTHRCGRLDEAAIDALVRREPALVCEAEAGDVILMRPLLLHSSHRATSSDPRRVVHVVFAATELPEPLRWYF